MLKEEWLNQHFYANFVLVPTKRPTAAKLNPPTSSITRGNKKMETTPSPLNIAKRSLSRKSCAKYDY
jgi:hypothetical protein